MPDPTLPGPDPTGFDPTDFDPTQHAELVRSLEAFGRTLQAGTNQPVMSDRVRLVDVNDSQGDPVMAKTRSAAVLALVAAVVAIAGIGAVAVHGVGNPDQSRAATATTATAGAATTTDATAEAGPDGQEPSSENTSPYLGAGPSTVLGADGTAIATIAPSANGEGFGFDVGSVDDQNLAYLTAVMAELLAPETGLQAPDGIDLGDYLADGGLTITTHLEPEAVAAAATAAADQPDVVDNGFATAVTILDPATGGVLAYGRTPARPDDGGIHRPAGSAFQFFTLAAALDDGVLADDTISTGPLSLDLGPEGEGLRERTTVCRDQGAQTVAAVSRSSNYCAYLRLGLVVGNNRVADLAQRLGVGAAADKLAAAVEAGTPVDPLLSLGTIDVTPVELAGAFAVAVQAAENRPWHRPRFVASVVDPEGSRRLDAPPPVDGLLGPEAARRLNEVLVSKVESGTGKLAMVRDQVVAGETGSIDNFTDAWFVGYSRHYVTAVWLGDPDDPDRSVVLPNWGEVFGGEVPAQMWADVMTRLHQDILTSPFDPPSPPDREAVVLEIPAGDG